MSHLEVQDLKLRANCVLLKMRRQYSTTVIYNQFNNEYFVYNCFMSFTVALKKNSHKLGLNEAPI